MTTGVLNAANAFRDAEPDAAEERRWLSKSQATFRALRDEGKLAPIWNDMVAEVDGRIARLDAGERSGTSARR